MPEPVDYDALAARYRGQAVQAQAVDYDALAMQHGGRAADAPPPAAAPAPKDERSWFRRLTDAQGQVGATMAHPDVVKGQAAVIPELATGAVKGAASTFVHGGDIVRRVTGHEPIADTPEMQRFIKPTTDLQKIGFGGEQTAEFMLPVGAVSKLSKGAPLFSRIMREAGTGALVAGAQTGGDPEAMIVQGGLAAAGPMVATAGRAARQVVGNMAAGAAEGGIGGALAGVARQGAPLAPKMMLVKALKPRATHTGFESALDRAMPEIRAAADAAGKPVTGLDDLLTYTKDAKKRIWQQYEQMAGPAREMGATVDLSPVGDAMAASIPKKLRLENPDAAARIEALAGTYRQRFPIQDVEQLLLETNAELDGFYMKYPGAQRAQLASNPEVAHTVAQAAAMRKALYATLDGPGEGAAARELKQRYGSLMGVEEEVFRRANVAKRQQPDSLSEQFSKARAAGEVARGLFKMSRGRVVSGMADIVGARANREMATFLKEQQTADALVRRAFQVYKTQPVPVAMPSHRPVSGLLGPGPRITPPPADASFVRGVPAMRAESSRLALPEGRPAIEMQPAPDGSFVRGVPAQYARRDVRGLLGPGQPPTAPQAPQAPRQAIPLPGDVQPDPSRVGSIRAVPADYAIDPTVTVKAGGFRVKQFSGDPDAAAAAVASPEVRGMLERMRDDLAVFKPQRGRIVNEYKVGGAANDSHYAAGGPGSPVGDDVRVISEQNVGNDQIAKAIDDLLAGKKPTNRLHTGALDAAMGYIEKRPGYRGPSVPAGLNDLPVMDAEPVDDGFAAFSSAVDDIAAKPEPPAPKPREIDIQEQSYIDWTANAGRVAANPAAASDKDLRRALGFLSHKRETLRQRALKEGRQVSPDVINGIRLEEDWYSSILREREKGRR